MVIWFGFVSWILLVHQKYIVTSIYLPVCHNQIDTYILFNIFEADD